jgi:hypothetical protein
MQVKQAWQFPDQNVEYFKTSFGAIFYRNEGNHIRVHRTHGIQVSAGIVLVALDLH